MKRKLSVILFLLFFVMLSGTNTCIMHAEVYDILAGEMESICVQDCFNRCENDVTCRHEDWRQEQECKDACMRKCPVTCSHMGVKVFKYSDKD